MKLEKKLSFWKHNYFSTGTWEQNYGIESPNFSSTVHEKW